MGEKVMAVTTLLPRAAGEIVAVRFVTSLTLVDQSIAALVAFSLALVTAVVLFSVWTGMFFIRSIVRPIGEIEATAAKIAEGNLDTRIENKYNDEIGKLSDTINHMAGELDKTERMKNEFISSVSVSYTHLDVYKRQAQSCIPARCRRRPHKRRASYTHNFPHNFPLRP